MRHLKALIILRILTISYTTCIAQENPWLKKETGSNPWLPSKQVTQKSNIETVEIEADTLVTDLKSDTVASNQSRNLTVIEATEKEDLKVITNSEVKSPQLSLSAIERKASNDYNAGFALGLSIPAVIFPPITVPILITSVFIPTPQQKRMIEEYKSDNPTADVQEIKAIKRGIRKKRAKRTATGAGIGLGVVLAALGIIIVT